MATTAYDCRESMARAKREYAICQKCEASDCTPMKGGCGLKALDLKRAGRPRGSRDPNSIASKARDAGVHPDTYARRIRRGWTDSQAAQKKLATEARTCIVSGVTYASIADLARAHRMLYETVRYRISRGASPEDAVREKSKTRKKQDAHRT